jgi:dihydroflavonol-4-reductase
MRVLVTGATGFVGSHATAALRRAGHDVRALVRDPARLAHALAPFGASADHVVGDMTDPAAVAAAVKGCDAVVHAAASLGFSRDRDRSSAAPHEDVNLVGARTVLTAALAAGADPVVYTSSVSAYLPTDAPVITLDSPLASARTGYATSKRDIELYVRELQAAGAPVASLVLGGVYGPDSPHADNGLAAVVAALGGFMFLPPGGLGVLDVRDVATMILRLLEPGRGPRRHLAGGHFLTWPEWTDTLSAAAGTDIVRQPVTAEEIIQLGREFDQADTVIDGAAQLLSEEAARIMVAGVPTDDSATLAELGCALRPPLETFADTVAHLRRRGLVAPAP